MRFRARVAPTAFRAAPRRVWANLLFDAFGVVLGRMFDGRGSGGPKLSLWKLARGGAVRELFRQVLWQRAVAGQADRRGAELCDRGRATAAAVDVD